MAKVVQQTFALGRGPWKTFSPFLFCVHHLDTYPAGEESMGPNPALLRNRDIGSDFSYTDGWSMYHGDVIPGFPQHPHRGFETVTMTRQGLVDHSDSLGATARYGQAAPGVNIGDVQWMTAGAGIQHSEMFPLINRTGPNTMELFQIWINLERRSKFAAPHFTMFWAEELPRFEVADAKGIRTLVTLTAGSIAGRTALAPPPESYASKDTSRVRIATLEIPAGGSFTLDASAADVNRAIYLVKGAKLSIGGTVVSARHGTKVDAAAEVTLEAVEGPADVLLLEGRPIDEPVVSYGPFVMNTQEEIAQAFADYRRTQFGGWPWPDPAHAHPRATGRHAKHPDGRIDTPPKK